MIAFLSRLFGGRAGEPAWIDTADLQRRIAAGQVLLVDVRQPEEFAAPPGHLPGAINVPLGDLAAQTAAIAARRQPGCATSPCCAAARMDGTGRAWHSSRKRPNAPCLRDVKHFSAF